MASYVNPQIQDKFESLTIDLKDEILKRDVQINNMQDLMHILEVIANEED